MPHASSHPSPVSERAFTLVELLVVTACIGLLCSLLFPALKSTREKARQIQCINNLKNIGIAALEYARENDEWLPHSSLPYNPYTNTNRHWKGALASYLGLKSTAFTVVEHGVFHCPSQTLPTCGEPTYGDNGFYGGYGWNWYNLGYINTDTYVRLNAINNPSQTIMAGDTSDWHLTTYPYRVFNLYYNQSEALSLRHNTGGNYLWVDGHVSWLSAQDAFANSSKYFLK